LPDIAELTDMKKFSLPNPLKSKNPAAFQQQGFFRINLISVN